MRSIRLRRVFNPCSSYDEPRAHARGTRADLYGPFEHQPSIRTSGICIWDATLARRRRALGCASHAHRLSLAGPPGYAGGVRKVRADREREDGEASAARSRATDRSRMTIRTIPVRRSVHFDERASTCSILLHTCRRSAPCSKPSTPSRCSVRI